MKILTTALSALLLWHCAAEKGTAPKDMPEQPTSPVGTDAPVSPSPPQAKTEATAALLLFSSNLNGNWEIFGIERLDGGLVNLTRHPGDDSDPAWSPDGTRIAFWSMRTGARRAIYTMNADGSTPSQLTQEPLRHASRPAWAPSGLKIAYISQFQQFFEIKLIDLQDSTTVALTRFATEGLRIGDLFWSPDGTHLAFGTTQGPRNAVNRSYTVPTDGSLDLGLLTTEAAPHASMSWSPDGSRIAFAARTETGNCEILVANADGSASLNLSRHPATDLDPVWSPDGTRIAFITNRDGDPEIYVMDTDGSNLRNLSRSLAYELRPRWSPDGRHIAYISATDGYALRLMDADGGNQTYLTRNGIGDFAWRPRQYR